VVKRLKAALRTNEPQATAVLMLTCLNLLAVFSGPDWPPLGLLLVAALFWPVLAFVANLIDPIPK